MPKQVSIYSAADDMQAEFLRQVLASHEIEATVTGGAMATLAGYLPATYARPEVFVEAADVERARVIVERFERSRRRGHRRRPAGAVDADASWTCANCGEVIEPQFTDCWKCQTPRAAASEADAKAQATPVRLPADPHIGVDLACVRCEYNLRNLPVDRVCPECAHPAFATLLQTMQSQQEWSLEHERALAPCLDFIEEHTGFPMEAIAFVARVWRRAADIASGGVTEAPLNNDDLAAALRDLAVAFLGDPLTAARAMQRWHLATGADVGRLRAVLDAFHLLDDEIPQA